MKKRQLRDPKEPEITILLAGNPNVGKSTIFNSLTGLHQHTGNWPGKTVETAEGRYTYAGKRFRLVDLPGTYSLSAHSPEEEITRDALSFSNADRVLLVADAVGLERNLYLIFQTLAITDRAVLCVNLMDEAEKRGIYIDTRMLSEFLGVPVVGVSARKKQTLSILLEVLSRPPQQQSPGKVIPVLPEPIRKSLLPMGQWLEGRFPISSRRAMWMAVTLIGSRDEHLLSQLYRWCGEDLSADVKARERLSVCTKLLTENGITDGKKLEETISLYWLRKAKELAGKVVTHSSDNAFLRERKLDRILTGRRFGFLVMLLLLTGIFALTIRGADYPSQLLSRGLFRLGDTLSSLLLCLGCPGILHDALIFGAYRMLAWVVAVMLPPMLIFFPFFTILEDVGYLPRIAFNLDHCFHRCGSCGKQALTMGMGLGCNAVGVTSCRIISSPKERLLSILTNSFTPCSGRFPMMILLIVSFLSPRKGIAALILCGCILLSVEFTLLVTKLLSSAMHTKENADFVLELPPYRRPQLGQILVRSLLDRAIFVLGRAAAVAAPAGLLLWVMAAVHVGGISLLSYIAAYLEPLGRLMGMDGVILLAFILGSPANETVIPIAMMIYLSASSLSGDLPSEQIRVILLEHGWTWVTAASTILFSMLHWPCTTTLLTIHKETGSRSWTFLAAILPTLCGIAGCLILHGIITVFR
ncbi:MAG: ferrous iron transport protein B [Oscillospiraceae bacterium]|nr:ferrous iron transport protein B [Oscillospiraceae bacterium]